MTLADYVHETVERYQTLPANEATKKSAIKLWRGINRRTIDPYIGAPIWDREWDICVVCDATRVDLMESVVDEYDRLPSAVGRHRSVASASAPWIERTFKRDLPAGDRVGYVTANPFTSQNVPVAESELTAEDVAHLDEVWDDGWQDIGNGLETVPPEVVTERAIAAWRHRHSLGFDRLVVHYMQPHEPFRSRPDWGRGDHKLLKNLVEEDAEAGPSVWPQLEAGEITMGAFWHAYQDNLRWVLDDVTERLLTNVAGTVAITADHGNGFGEWGCWHHPPCTVAPTVRTVPWLTTYATDSRSVEPGLQSATPGSDGEEMASVSVDQRLTALGYKQ